MATKNTPTPPVSKPGPAPTSRPQPVQKNDGHKILSENQRQTTVFQTRPTPPDPGKK
jgi:hypothetical protein